MDQYIRQNLFSPFSTSESEQSWTWPLLTLFIRWRKAPLSLAFIWDVPDDFSDDSKQFIRSRGILFLLTKKSEKRRGKKPWAPWATQLILGNILTNPSVGRVRGSVGRCEALLISLFLDSFFSLTFITQPLKRQTASHKVDLSRLRNSWGQLKKNNFFIGIYI